MISNIHRKHGSGQSRRRLPFADRSAPGSSREAAAGSLGTIFLIAVLCVLAIGGPERAGAEDNLLPNGDFTEGTGESPAHWRSHGWQSGSDITTYLWKHAKGAPGEVEISNAKPNDARWGQTLHLGPGWYHFTASIRTEGVGENKTGASLSLMEDGIISADLHGTNDWQTVGFYLKVGESGADVEVVCRLGGFASLNVGKAACRDLRGVKIAEPPPDASQKYDLDLIRRGGTPPPTSNSSTDNSTAVVLLAFLAALALIGLFGWRRLREKGGQTARLIAPPTLPQADAPSKRDRRKIEIALFLVALLSFAYFYQASDHSTASRFDLIRALLERGTVWIEGYAGFNTADIVELNSHVYSNKAPGGAFTGILPWLFVTTILKAFLSPNGLYWALATWLTTVFSVSLLAAISIVLAYRFALLLGAGNGRAVAMALTLAFATIMFPYATEFTAEPVAALGVFAAFYLLARPEGQESLWQSLAAGLLAGWAVLCDYPTFIPAAIVGFYAAWRLRSWRKLAPFALGAAAVALVMMGYNELAFGNPFFLSYEAYMLPGSTQFPEQSAGFAGVTYPRLDVLWNVLFAPQRGLFFCNPVLLLTIPGLFFFWRRGAHRAEFAVVAISIASFILLNGSYGKSVIYWGGGTATGPRHMLSAVPFMVLALAFLPENLDGAFGALALLSAFLMLMAVAVEPHLPYEYQNPLRDFAWPAYLRGDLAYNKDSYFGGGPMAGDSVAFNLGKLAGLPGALQLWPLGAVWIAAAVYLMGRLELWRQASQRRIAGVAAALAVGGLFAPPTIGALLPAHLDQPNGLLGRYYAGLRPNGFAPHIQRVDKRIDFDSIVEMGALPSPSFVVWTGRILAPTAGLYRFTITVDDAGWLKIDGRTVIQDPGEVTKMRDSGGISLTAGVHSIEVGQRNIWGDASMHLLWQPPGGAEEVVPSRFLIPEISAHLPG